MALLPLSRTIATGPLLVAGALALEQAGRWLGLPGAGVPGPWVGLLLGARLVGGPALAPWTALAAVAALLVEGRPWGPALALAVVIALATEGAARGLVARAGGARCFDQLPGVAAFVLYACLLAPAAVALAGVALLPAGDAFAERALRWVVALAFEQVAVAPVVVAIALDGRAALARLRQTPLEGLAIVGLSAGVLWLTLARHLPVQPALFGLLVWMEMRARFGGGMPLCAAYAASLGWGTAHGLGPFVMATPDQGLQAFELRLAFQFPVYIMLHALLAANDRHLVAVQQQNDELRAVSALKAGYADALEREVAARTEEARRARDEAEAANEAKSLFLARMSHEIRTPITALKGFAELLAEPGLADALRLRYAAIMQRNSAHLGVLVDDILDLTRIEAGTLEVGRAAFPLAPLLADLEQQLAERAREKGLGFALRLEGPLPATIEADATRLRQVLQNLADNAIKFTERGSVVVAAVMAPGDVLVVTVSDTGLGMDTAHLTRLFQPFEQGDASMTRRFGGAGLGLAISRALVQAMGGELAVRSTPRAGSTFRLTLPVGVPAAPGPAATSERAPARAGLVGRVLLAEDGPDNQLLFRALLEAAGLEVTLVADGRAALEAALAAQHTLEPYDVVLMDMQMPVLDGYAATRALREAGYDGPILALTAHAMAGEHERCLAAGCDGYMSKPIDRQALLETVAHHLPAPPAALDLDGLELDDLVAMFKATLQGRLAAIATAANHDDHDALQRLAHQLRGAAGSYGFAAISAAAAALDEAARERLAGVALAARVAELERECRLALQPS